MKQLRCQICDFIEKHPNWEVFRIDGWYTDSDNFQPGWGFCPKCMARMRRQEKEMRGWSC